MNIYNLIIRLYDSNDDIIHCLMIRTNKLNIDVRIEELQRTFANTVRITIDVTIKQLSLP